MILLTKPVIWVLARGIALIVFLRIQLTLSGLLAEGLANLTGSETLLLYASAPVGENRFLVCDKDLSFYSFWEKLKEYAPNFDFSIFKERTLLATTQKEETKKEIIDSKLIKEVLLEGNKYLTFSQQNRNSFYEVFFPLEDKNNQKIGIVSIKTPAIQIQQPSQITTKMIFGVFLVLIFFFSSLS